MAIPIIYNWRNLWVRKTTTFITALSIAVATFVCTFLLGVLSGFTACLKSSGSTANAIVLREGARREVVSSVSHEAFSILKHLPGIASASDGSSLASPEIVALITLRKAGSGRANVVVRGIGLAGMVLRAGPRIVEGRSFHLGAREIIMGRDLASQLELGLGGTINFGRGRWQLVGLIDAPGTSYNSEIWADVDAVASDFGRNDYSSVLVHLAEGASDASLNAELTRDHRLHLKAVNQLSYFEAQSEGARPLGLFSLLIIFMMALGSAFAVMNTMHTAISTRANEIAILRSLGFSQINIVNSFLVEAAILASLGGLLGTGAALASNAVKASTTNFLTFSLLMFKVHVTPFDVLLGFALALTVGLLGSLPSAWWATNETLVQHH